MNCFQYAGKFCLRTAHYVVIRMCTLTNEHSGHTHAGRQQNRHNFRQKVTVYLH